MADPIRYRVDLSDRVHHLVRVTVTVPADLAPAGRLVLSVWTPGSYVVRDYVHHVQWVRARSATEADIPIVSDGGTAWRLPDDAEGEMEVTFELYANDLTVRTNHVDDHHALLVPAASFPYVEGGEDRPHEVTLPPTPEGHRTFSLLPPAATEDTFVAEHRDHLIDSAFEVGALPHVDFEAAEVPHRFVWAGHGGAPDLDRVATDTTAIVEACAALFPGGVPCERYTFLALGWDEGGGGLEHRDGSVLQIPIRVFQDEELYARLLSLIAHEYLHLWNVKRLVPAALVRPRYDVPTRSESLWVAEGWTAYYDELLPTRAGVWRVDRLLDTLQSTWARVRATPGTRLQSLRQASHDAWTKHYVHDENSPNVMTDYYAHGSLVAFELDLRLRERDPDGDGLDEVFRLLWDRHADTSAGYTEEDVIRAVADVADDALAQLVEERVSTPGLPDLSVVSALGLRFVDTVSAPVPHLGVQTNETDHGVTFGSVLRDGPAWDGGLTGGDRLLAIDGRTVARGQLDVTLRAHAPGDTVEVTVARGPRLLRRRVTLGAPVATPRLTSVADPSDTQRSAFLRWCGRDLGDVRRAP